MAVKESRKNLKKGKDKKFVIAYLLTWLTGVLIFMVSKPSDKRLRFHALQATMLGIAITVLSFIPVIGWVLAFLLWLAGMVTGAMAYNGNDVSLPIIGGYSEKYA
jgi:uncharacterized membrane protein